MFIFMFEETVITFDEECTASQTQQTVVIYGPLFRNYLFDYHEIWQKLSRGLNFEVWKFSQKYKEFYLNL